MGDIERLLDYMRLHGSSVTLSWDEEADCWQAAWIVGGECYAEVAKEPLRALQIAEQHARMRVVVRDFLPTRIV